MIFVIIYDFCDFGDMLCCFVIFCDCVCFYRHSFENLL